MGDWPTCVCGHHWSDHIPPRIHKRGVSCTVTQSTATGQVHCPCEKFVNAAARQTGETP